MVHIPESLRSLPHGDLLTGNWALLDKDGRTWGLLIVWVRPDGPATERWYAVDDRLPQDYRVERHVSSVGVVKGSSYAEREGVARRILQAWLNAQGGWSSGGSQTYSVLQGTISHPQTWPG